MAEEEEKASPREGYPKGLKAVWRPREILPYSPELIPPDPKIPIKPPPTPEEESGEEREVDEVGEQSEDIEGEETEPPAVDEETEEVEDGNVEEEELLAAVEDYTTEKMEMESSGVDGDLGECSTSLILLYF